MLFKLYTEIGVLFNSSHIAMPPKPHYKSFVIGVSFEPTAKKSTTSHFL